MPIRKCLRRVGATKEEALQELADTKARVAEAMEDTVPIKSDNSIEEVSGTPSPPFLPLKYGQILFFPYT